MTESWDFWVCALVTFGSTLPGIGFSLAAALKANSDEAKINAAYGCARCIALAVVGAAVLFNQSRAWLMAIAVTMIIVQLIDSAIGIRLRSLSRAVGPAAIAIANTAALVWLIM